MNEETKCIRCDKPGKTKWTINGDGGYTIMWLCDVHEKPIRELLAASVKNGKRGIGKARTEDLPPSPAPRRKTVKPINWTPPA